MATAKVSYGADAAITITLASLASSSSLLAGRESAYVDNTTNLALDYLVSGKITTGTTPTANKSVEVWVVAPIEDTPTWPAAGSDCFDGTDTAASPSTRNQLFSSARLAHVYTTPDTTSDRTAPIAPFSVASLFGGTCPKMFSIYVVHDTGVALNATAGNHAFYAQPIYQTVA